MKKVELSVPEFLSLYTGRVFVKDMGDVRKTINKVFNCESPNNTEILLYKLQFTDYINTKRPRLVKKLEELKEFRKQSEINTNTQANEYCRKFETILGTKKIKVDSFNSQNRDCDELSL